jgi:hypothetical protein
MRILRLIAAASIAALLGFAAGRLAAAEIHAPGLLHHVAAQLAKPKG